MIVLYHFGTIKEPKSDGNQTTNNKTIARRY